MFRPLSPQPPDKMEEVILWANRAVELMFEIAQGDLSVETVNDNDENICVFCEAPESWRGGHTHNADCWYVAMRTWWDDKPK